VSCDAGPWLRSGAAARLLGIDPATLWRWRSAGVVPAWAMLPSPSGKQTRYARPWVEAQVGTPLRVVEARTA
jgi:hypothetical protein